MRANVKGGEGKPVFLSRDLTAGLLIILSSEVSWYSLLEWHLPEVMMNYLESDGRVASSEVRHTCTPELRPTCSPAA